MTFPPRTPQQWETWWEGFKKRNGITNEKLREAVEKHYPLPHPSEDATPPPPDPRDPESSKED